MDMIKIKFSALQNSIFRLLCMRSGEPMSKRSISEVLGVSPTAVANALKLLEEERMVTVRKIGKMNASSVEINAENARIAGIRRSENLRMIYESGLAEFLSEKFAGRTIILFGSYSLGEDTKKSDIDIAIIGYKSKYPDISIFEKSLERKIIIQFYDDLSSVNKNLRTNIMNGIILSGSV